MLNLRLLALSLSAFLLPSVLAFCPSNCCVDQCFTKAPCEDQETAYKKIFEIVQAVRGTHLAYRTQGTVFAYGGSVGFATHEDLPLFQPRLAALVSLASNAGCKNNPAMIIQHRVFGGFHDASSSCGNACQTAQNLLNQPTFRHESITSGTPSEADEACKIANYLNKCEDPLDYGELCGKSIDTCGEDRLLVSFHNTADNLHETCRSFGPGVLIKIQSENVTDVNPIPQHLLDNAPDTVTEVETHVNLEVVTRLLQ